MVVSLDSTAATRFPSRLLINPLLAPGREAYEFGNRTQLLLGERYALVRPEIRRIRPTRATSRRVSRRPQYRADCPTVICS